MYWSKHLIADVMMMDFIPDLVGHWQYVWSSSCIWSDGSREPGVALVPWLGRHSLGTRPLVLPGMLRTSLDLTDTHSQPIQCVV